MFDMKKFLSFFANIWLVGGAAAGGDCSRCCAAAADGSFGVPISANDD
jgi:hypothetical protein